MAGYEILRYGDTIYVIKNGENNPSAIISKGSVSGDEKTIRDLNQMKASNESLQDYVTRVAKKG